MSLIPFCCVFRSFYGSKSSIRPNIVPVSIPQTNISEDDLQIISRSDDDFDASSESQSTMNQQKKRSLNQAASLNKIILKNYYLRTAIQKLNLIETVT